MSSQKWRNGMTDIGLVIRKYIVYGRWFVIARLYVQIPMRYRKITGLTQVWPSADVLENNQYRLVIPNLEIRKLFIRQIREWFRDVSRKDGETLNQFCEAFPDQNPKKIEEIFSDYLWNTISIRDTASSKRKTFIMESFWDFWDTNLTGLLNIMRNQVLVIAIFLWKCQRIVQVLSLN